MKCRVIALAAAFIVASATIASADVVNYPIDANGGISAPGTAPASAPTSGVVNYPIDANGGIGPPDSAPASAPTSASDPTSGGVPASPATGSGGGSIPQIPVATPDICAPMSGCLTFTNSTFLAGLQQIQGLIAQIKMAAANLESRPPTVGNIQGFIGSVTSAGKTVNQMTKADVAANAVVSAAPTNAALAAKANADVTSANGAQKQAQAGNEHLSAIDQTTQAQLDLAAEQQQQDAANRQAIVNALKPPAALTIPSIM